MFLRNDPKRVQQPQGFVYFNMKEMHVEEEFYLAVCMQMFKFMQTVHIHTRPFHLLSFSSPHNQSLLLKTRWQTALGPKTFQLITNKNKHSPFCTLLRKLLFS